ncbi:murein hydrolase activator EnvC family protein [Microbulbifer thermotolerans]|uniref:Peptidoglycan DD-metalloendopeptidase family protein n=1 Tax=Microbulbifer thermotolerans TaxID=252514 RepID=A0AB35I0V4_MICTH|nr:peptidoglycan DD-metalloendopeptidase family protein [Microbulbifer thermotolerans]MCX2781064.1 peptidoglycan DD-metalloendopeptidase family protein [Microbulbifer thermotolerans]MCX2783637.1 peptidoglycan DD-metalloendopeptidase family protein [Microbulbifer thermotolerans]MCX2796234.1 peptidoglycan DD-metalloendopeptidase family protein [Microbulbifer thermotolerans]MCX2803220.1 peptidoglycan DD-metalloendopeptidase family protein [Microbulbifer thermotolerans]MCX2806381.1 peptidoglycan D
MLTITCHGTKARGGVSSAAHRLAGVLAGLIIPILLLASLPAAAQTDDKQQARLAEIKQRIESLQRELSQVRNERDQLLKELENNEKNISELHQRIDKIKRDMQSRGEKLRELREEQQQLEESRRSMQRRVEQEVAAAYRLGRQEQIKLLLNQQNPQHIARHLRYHQYFLQARSQVIDSYLTTLSALQTVSSSIQRERDTLDTERRRLHEQKQQLLTRQRARKSTLDKLAAQLADKSGELQQLQSDRSRLQKLVDEVSRTIAALISPGDQQPFAKQRGRMQWPVKGRRANAFGATRASGIRWKGITIRAAEGEPVHAIHRGRVVFSDYLRGQGMLLILDHGDGYMSLYAHNQSLTRSLGEWVERGDVIARVGNTGGLEHSGLYFEIRHRGIPQDPTIWCRR